jgi:hypothetical protein
MANHCRKFFGLINLGELPMKAACEQAEGARTIRGAQCCEPPFHCTREALRRRVRVPGNPDPSDLLCGHVNHVACDDAGKRRPHAMLAQA